MYRHSDGPHNSIPSGRPVSSLSSGSNRSPSRSRPLSGPPSPASQLNYLQWIANGNSQRKKDRDSRSMGTDFQFPPQLMQQELLAFQEATFSTVNTRQPTGKKSPKPDTYKTVMCQAWLESKICSFAENCRFAHGEAELRPSKTVPTQNSKYKTKLCDKYTTTGLCPYGSRCLFIHPDNGNNAYIRPDKLVEVTQRHALADMNVQKTRPVTPDIEHMMRRPQLRPHPSWPLEPANFFSDKNEDEPQQGLHAIDIQKLFGCFESSTTPNRVSLASGLSGYASGGSSPFSTSSSSSVNLSSSDDEQNERDYFRITGLEHLAEELTRNLTTTELF